MPDALDRESIAQVLKDAGAKGQKIELVLTGWENARTPTPGYLETLMFTAGMAPNTRYLVLASLFGQHEAKQLHPALGPDFGMGQYPQQPYGYPMAGPMQLPQKKSMADEFAEIMETAVKFKGMLKAMDVAFGDDEVSKQAMAQKMGVPYGNSGKVITRTEPLMDGDGNPIPGQYVTIEHPYDPSSPQYGIELWKTIRADISSSSKEKPLDVGKLLVDLTKVVQNITPKQNDSGVDKETRSELKEVRRDMTGMMTKLWEERTNNVMTQLREVANERNQLAQQANKPLPQQITELTALGGALQSSGMFGLLTPEERIEDRKYQREEKDRDRMDKRITEVLDFGKEVLTPVAEGSGEALGEYIKDKINSPNPAPKGGPVHPPQGGSEQPPDLFEGFDEQSFTNMRNAMDELGDHSPPPFVTNEQEPEILHEEIRGKDFRSNPKVRKELKELF